MKNLSWETIYAQQSPKLLAVCRRYVGNIALAEDLMHDAFMTAIQKQAQFSGKGAVGAWLRRITVNTVLMHLRKKKGFTESLKEDIETLSNVTPEQVSEDPKSIILNSGFEVADLLEIIDQLPNHHKIVFNLYVFEEYSHKEIAKELNISVGTSKSHLARARKKLQKILLEKIDEMNKKKKRAILYFFPFLKKDKPETSYIDEVFKKELGDLSIKPEGQLPEALKTALKEAPPLPTSPVTSIFKTGLLSTLAVSVIVVSSIIYFSNDSSSTPNVVPEFSQTENNIIPNQNQETQKAIMVNTPPLPEIEEKLVNEENKRVQSIEIKSENKPIQTQKTEPTPTTIKKTKTKLSEAPQAPTKQAPAEVVQSAPPVVIQKKVIVRDTVYQIQEENEN